MLQTLPDNNLMEAKWNEPMCLVKEWSFYDSKAEKNVVPHQKKNNNNKNNVWI